MKNVLEVERSIDGEDAPGAVKEEEGEEQRGHVRCGEDGGWQEWVGGDAGFDVDGREEGEDAKGEGDGDIRGAPTGRSVSRLGDGEDGEG